MGLASIIIWIVWPLACFFLVRPLFSKSAGVRLMISTAGCVSLIAWTFRDLTPGGSMEIMLGYLFGLLTVCMYLVQLTSLPEPESSKLSIKTLALQLLWIFLPVN